jgi:hypothetical protein
MRTGNWSVAALALAATCGARANPQGLRVNRDASIVQDFEDRVQAYMKLHQQAEARLHLPALKPTEAPEKIQQHERQLADGIRSLRPRARQGDIFTKQIAAEFRRLIRITLAGPQANRIRASLRHGEPVDLRLRVNQNYPHGAPLQNTPPTLLLNLPKLPASLEYRVVGRDLGLHDIDANLLVDFIPNAIL